jgi:hypothetical protein
MKIHAVKCAYPPPPSITQNKPKGSMQVSRDKDFKRYGTNPRPSRTAHPMPHKLDLHSQVFSHYGIETAQLSISTATLYGDHSIFPNILSVGSEGKTVDGL